MPDQILHDRQQIDPHLTLLGTELYIQHNKIQRKFENTVANLKIQYYYSTNYNIPKLLMAYSVVIDDEFLLEWCECFGQP